ncbi:hypothetical protein ISU07_23675, partial [Nocardioides islandensis]
MALLLLAFSASFTWTDTVEEAGPSGNVHTKLPPTAVVNVLPTCEALAPQETPTTANESPESTSETLNAYVCWVPSLTDRSFPGARVTVGAEFATVTESLTVVPDRVPSLGVTSTRTTSPLSPLPTTPRFSVSVNELDPEVVLTMVPFTFHTYVNDTASPSASDFVAVAVTVWFVVGPVGDNTTVATGALLPTVTESLTVVPDRVPSLGVTSTRTTSPLSPLPTTPRFSVSVNELDPEVVLTMLP